MSVNPKKKSTGDLSALIEINPKDFDDRTSAIDAGELRKARRAAGDAIRSEEKKAARVGVFPSQRRPVSPMLFLLLFGAAGAASYYYYGDQLRDRLFSVVPQLTDVSPEELIELRAAVREPGHAALALSKSVPGSPFFYFSGGLADTASLSVVLHPDAASIPAEHVSDVRFPVSLAKGFGRSRSVQLTEGYYSVKLMQEEHELTSKRYFLGGSGTPDAQYAARLENFKSELQKKAQDREQLRLGAGQLQIELDSTSNSFATISRMTNKKARIRAWNEFHGRWLAQAREPRPELRPDWTLIRNLHEAQHVFITTGRSPAKAISLMMQEISMHLAALKASQ
ncbi:MAG: hypothetical protein ACXWPM_02735 [Bdellovibrionota bacterium]